MVRRFKALLGQFKVNEPVVKVPSVSSISPSVVTVDEATTFTIDGENLKPENVVFFDGKVCSNEIGTATDGSSIIVECTPSETGSKRVTVKSQFNGSIISGPQLWVDVEGSNQI